MKKILIILLLFFAVFFFSCKKNNNVNKDDNKEIDTTDPIEVDPEPILDPDPIPDPDPEPEPDPIVSSISLEDGDLIVFLDDIHELNLSIEGSPDYRFEYNEEIIKIEDGLLFPLKEGETTLTLIFDEEIIKSINVKVFDKPNELLFFDLPETIEAGRACKIELNDSNVTITLSNTSLATYSAKTGYLTTKAAGELTITATYLYDETLTLSATITITPKIPNASNALVDCSYTDLKSGDKIVIDGKRYTFGTTLFTSIKDAMVSNNKILVANTNETSLDISKQTITLEGCSDNVLNLKITIAASVNNITISKLNFTGDSKIILSGANNNIKILENSFIDTTLNSAAWAENNSYKSGLIELVGAETYHNNITIKDNTFNNIGDCGINVNNTHNLTIEGNSFNTFSKDAVRLNNGVIKQECTWLFKGNTFIDSVYSGIYFRTYATNSGAIYHFVDIRDNHFEYLGRSSEQYSGAIVFRNYQEGGASVNIAYNDFNNCAKFIFLRNNAVADNQANFNGYVMGNIFRSVPSKYYFNNLNSSDKVSTNPVQTKLIDNVYLDASGNDITPDSAKFIGAKTNTILVSNKYDELYHFNLRHVYTVGDVIEINAEITFSDDGYYSFENGKLTILKEGLSEIRCGDSCFEIIAYKQEEMIVAFIRIALGEIGYEEMDENGNTGTSGNYTKYGAWYGINPGAWCAMYVSWCANQAKVPTTIIPKYASVQIGMDWYKDKGLFQYKESYTPKAGDIMFQKSNGASHTGIVLYCDGTTLYTVEGNTSDKCAMRQYSVTNAKITGYGTPQWPYYSPDGYNFSSGKVEDGSGHSTT